MLLPENVKIGENPKVLSDLLSDAFLFFTGVADKSWPVPAPGDLVEYKDGERIKHPTTLKLLKELGFHDGNTSGTYQVVVRKFYEPNMDGMMIKLGIKRI